MKTKKISFQRFETWLFMVLLLVMIAIGANRNFSNHEKTSTTCSSEKGACGGCSQASSCKTENNLQKEKK